MLDPLAAHGAFGRRSFHPEVMSYEGLPDPLTAPTNTFVHVRWAKGDVAQGFRRSELIVERTYRTQLVHQGYIEPHTCVVKSYCRTRARRSGRAARRRWRCGGR